MSKSQPWGREKEKGRRYEKQGTKKREAIGLGSVATGVDGEGEGGGGLCCGGTGERRRRECEGGEKTEEFGSGFFDEFRGGERVVGGWLGGAKGGESRGGSCGGVVVFGGFGWSGDAGWWSGGENGGARWLRWLLLVVGWIESQKNKD
ncbi:uncharacterized protein [Spinacia oleracea]|uniref:Uncharacterized protein n=1 Tax=Spinacia oleracea TaxID=3562 RepID=A0ABM3QRR8_SPIOL|nr:uncharacterized protein LOC130461828 [Spinacia oleracea]